MSYYNLKINRKKKGKSLKKKEVCNRLAWVTLKAGVKDG